MLNFHFKDKGRNERRSMLRDLDKKFGNRKFIQKFEQDYLNDLHKNIGILCLTTDPKNPKMWDSYANFHSGVCIGYNSKKMFGQDEIFLGSGGAKVNYWDEDKLPEIIPYRMEDRNLEFLTIVFSKRKIDSNSKREYEFEDEYRLVKFNSGDYKEVTEYKSDRIVTVNKDSIADVIFGKEMNPDLRDELINFCKTNLSNVSLFDEELLSTGEIKFVEIN